ncbi:hypothetical protein BDW59DRAFT_144043 [Aspergillus cavernicola]|uniref:Transcription factor domain-containing protein n=1 Tax=Aspergillus cavernicola TaxID=176166 RepID=A0ABR4IK15_9EURO
MPMPQNPSALPSPQDMLDFGRNYLGVSMAQAIGINRPKQGPFDEIEWLAYNTWWCMYVFEKIVTSYARNPNSVFARIAPPK